MVDGMNEYQIFLDLHSSQLKSANVPQIFWHTAFCKLKNELFDAGDTFLLVDDGNDSLTVIVKSESGVKCNDESHIYLVDHAWTFEAKEAALHLRSIPGLLERAYALMKLSPNLTEEEKFEDVYREIWKYVRPYSRTVAPNDLPTTFWYLMDEFGSSIHHSNTPNFRAVPFFYISHDMAYTLLFPVTDVEENEEVTIDYVEGVAVKDVRMREALLVPWTKQIFPQQPRDQYYMNKDYFLSGANHEILPVNPDQTPSRPVIFKVYSEYIYVLEYLKHPDFVVTDSEEEADILWLTRHFYDFKNLAERRPNTFVNQFPSERVITTKDLLSIVSLQDIEGDWFPETYNLLMELPNFVAEFQRRDDEGLDNHWICKPWNLARAIDTTVSNNINYILRLPFTGPKIAQKYVENQVLYDRPDVGRVKFDVRYVVLLESVQPLKLYCYKEFFLRFANKPFDLSDLWDYEKHFTVMNYREDSNLHEVTCEDFKTEFSLQYPEHAWDDIERDILQSLKRLFISASIKPPPYGLCHSPQSRALYAADLVLSWRDKKIHPLLLEVNFAPDCERACRYYPSFFDDVFSLLFKGEVDTDRFFVL